MLRGRIQAVQGTQTSVFDVKKLFVFLLIMIATFTAGCGNQTPVWQPRIWYPADERIHINHLQLKGTHNSYHVAPEEFYTKQWDYTHPPLYQQFEEMRVRQIELDVHFVTEDQRFRVFHIPFVDEGTTCYWFTECLEHVRRWSDEHPWHLPVFIFIEPKDDADIFYITPYEPIEGHLDELEAEILSVFPRERILTPDEVKGYHSSLSEAVTRNGWPALSHARGRVIFVLLDSGEHRYEYTYGGVSLDGRLMFVTSHEGLPFAAVFSIDNPIDNEERIRNLVEQGYIVRTRADALQEAWDKDFTRQQAAQRSGAQLISTDYPLPGIVDGYYFDFPHGEIALCNPVTSPPLCSSELLETSEGPPE